MQDDKHEDQNSCSDDDNDENDDVGDGNDHDDDDVGGYVDDDDNDEEENQQSNEGRSSSCMIQMSRAQPDKIARHIHLRKIKHVKLGTYVCVQDYTQARTRTRECNKMHSTTDTHSNRGNDLRNYMHSADSQLLCVGREEGERERERGERERKREREREGDGDRDRDRQTDRQADRQADRQTGRQRQTGIQRKRVQKLAVS